MEDLMDDANEMNEIMGRSMGNMDDIDDDELEAELEGLDDELMDDLENGSKLFRRRHNAKCTCT